jgi:hypothetical protein
MRLYLFIIFVILSTEFHLFGQTASGTGAWETSSNWSTTPDAATLSGTISSSAVSVTGIITRTGALSLGNTLTVSGTLTVNGAVTGSNSLTVSSSGSLTINGNLSGGNTIVVNGTLTVNGSVTATGGSITVNSGGTLYISSNLASSINITVNAGGTLIVLGSVNVTGGSVNISGNMIVGGNFTSSSVTTTLSLSGNIVIAGNFSQSGGGVSIASSNTSSFYVIGTSSNLNTANYNTSLCTITNWTTYAKTCTSGSYSDLQANDYALWVLTNQVLGLSCGITISQQASNLSTCASNSATFSVIASGATTYQWQVDNGSGYSNLSNGGVYSGVTSASLSISSATGLTGYTYRCVLSASTCIVYSYGATLTTITATLPSITTQPSTTAQNLCLNGSATALAVVATAGSGSITGYQWYSNTTSSNTGGVAITGATSASYAPSTSIAGILYYYCVVTNSNGCTTTSNVSGALTVNDIPTILSTTPGSRCGTGTVALGATASAGTINWYVASTGGTSLGTGTSYTTASLSSTTIYYVDATNNGCTTGSRTPITATVNTTPTITATTPASRCDAGTVTLGAAASAGTINWYAASTGGISLGTGTSYTTASLSSTTIYYVDATNNGCTTGSRTPITATVNTTPTITATTPASRCDAGTVALGAAASAGTINWYAASTGGTSLGTGTSYTTASLSSTATYYVDATNNGCTTGSRTAVIATVNTTPTITATTPASRCGTGTLALGATASAGTINWYAASTGGTSLGTGTSYTTASISSTATYYVDATNNGCTTASRTSVLATVNAIPVTPSITASGSTTLCNGGSVTLTSSAGTSYLWSTGATTAAISATASGSYTVRVTNALGCQSAVSSATTIVVNPRPTSAITGTAAICNGSTTTISVALTGTSPWSLTYYDGSSSTSITGITANPYTFDVTPNASKTYTITALSDYNCTALATDRTGSAAISIRNRPTSDVSGSATICNGGSTNVSVALTGTSPWALTYSNGSTSATVSGITASPYILSVSPIANTTYTITALNDLYCNAQAADMTSSATIVVNSRPTSVIGGTATICSGSSTDVSIALTGIGPWNLTYSDGSASTTVNTINTNPYKFSVLPTSTKTYTVTALSDTKCSALSADMTGSATVTVNIPASASVLSGTATICSGSGTNLKVAITGGASPYKVILSDGSTTSGYLSGNNILKSPTVTTTYSITSVQDANGCYSAGLSGSAVVTVISTPATPSVIIPASTLYCQGGSNSFSVTNDPVVASYTWSYNGTGATLTPSGNSVGIVFGASDGGGTISVKATNACGTSSASTLAITVNSNVTPSVSIAVSPTGTICYGSTLTYTATPVKGGTPTYQWYLGSTAVGTNSNTWSANYILSSDAVKCVMTSSLCSVTGTNPATSNIITTTINKDVINLTSVSATALCAGSPISVNFTTPCAFANTNSFIAQLSNASGSFTSPVTIGTLAVYAAGSYTINATIPAATATGTGYLVRVISSTGAGVSGSSSAITISSSSGTPIAATTYGSGVWNVFCYTGNSGYGIASGASSPGNVNTYLGYYTENNLSFDTRNRWTTGTSPATTAYSATYGSAYIGCSSLPATYIYLSIKRTNIPCGNYQIDIPYHDDAYELYIDGVQKATHNGCCDSHTGVWTGWIGPANQIEIRLFQGAGSSGIQATFTATSLLTVSPSPTVCSGASTTLVATGGGSSVTYAWSPSTFLNTASGATVVSTPTATTAYTVSATDATSGCSTTANVTVNVSSTINLAVTSVPNSTVSCQGVTSTTMTASGANTYTWSPATGLNTTTGPVVIANPGVNVTYTLTGNNGCTTATKTIAFTGQIPGDSLAYTSGAWYALCYDTTLFTKYYGYYTESGLSFNTTTKWNSTNGPATAANTTYHGCYMNGTYYSVKLKRTGVPCGYYSVTVNNNDDYVWFYVNGVQVYYATYATASVPNVWTGFIGPSTQLEFRLINYSGPGNLQVTFTPLSGIPNLSTPTTVCAGTSTTISTGTITGDSYSWSSSVGENSWLSTTTGVSTVVTPPATTASGGHYFVRTLTDGTTGCSVKDSLLVTVDPLSNTSVTPTDTTVYCSAATVVLTAKGASSYTWSPSTGLSATSGSIVSATPGVSTTYTVSGSNNCNIKDATAKVTVVPLVADNTYPTGKWNVYGYNSSTWTNYTGYYTTTGSGTTGYDFDTRTQWAVAYGPSYATATGGTAYSGCTMGIDNFTTSFKRTGFTCGFYQIDMVYQDDAAELWIDGLKVWSNATYTSTVQSNIYSCFLTNTSLVEFRQKEGTGGAVLAVKFTSKTPVFTSITVSPTTAICSGGSVTLTAAANGVGNTYTWSPVTGLSTTTGTTTTASPTVTTKYYVRVSNCSGTVYGDTAITVNVLQPSIINTNPVAEVICENGSTSFSITSSNTLSYQWEYSANAGVSWSSVTDGGIYSGATTQTLTLTTVTYAYNSYKYRCRTTNGACSTIFSSDALLTVNQVPVNPGTITGTATVCQNFAGIVYAVPAVTRATSYTWTLPAGAIITSGTGTNSITVTFGTASGTITVVGVNSCGSSATAATFPVVVNTGVPSDPGAITGSASVCIGSSGITYTVPSVTGASSYQWTVPTGATITAGATTNTITVSYSASAISGNVTVVGVNPCGNSGTASTLAVTVNSSIPGNPVTITGTTAVCSGTSSSYSLGLVTGATSYTWTYPTGSSISSGSGTNNITVLFGTSSGAITAAATNGCGSSTPVSLSVTVSNPLLTSPGTISGSNSVCQSFSGIGYSVTALTGVTSYTWSLPSGASITSGSGTSSIITSYGAAASSGNVSVYGTNLCGNSPASTLAVAVNSGIPNNPGSISGTTTVCMGSTGKIYSIGAVTGATSYNWTLPSGASITSGAGTNNITVSFSATAISGTLSVVGVNGCGSSTTPASLVLSVISSVLTQPSAFTTSSASVCSGQSNVIYTVPNDASATSYTWSYSGTDATFASTTNSVSLSFGSSATGGTLSVVANNDCGASSVRSLVVTVNPVPTISAMTSTVCSGIGFTVTPVNSTNGVVPAGTTYSWPVPVVTGGLTGGAASSGSPTSITGTLTNSTASSQTATYTVTPVSGSCTGSSFTVIMTITANNTITLSSGTGTDAQKTCFGNAITQIRYSTTGATGATFSGLPTGVSGSWSGNVVTINGAPSVLGAFNYIITLTGGCTVTKSGTITIYLTPTTGPLYREPNN